MYSHSIRNPVHLHEQEMEDLKKRFLKEGSGLVNNPISCGFTTEHYLNTTAMDQQSDKTLRQQLVKHMEGGEAFKPLDEFVKNIPFVKVGIVPENLPYSFWQQFYHLRMTQYDILEFSRNPDYQSPKWPDDYWPAEPAPESESEWEETLDAYFGERNQLSDFILDPAHSLMEPFPHGTGQTLLREALLVIEHTAYHTGELVVIMRFLGLHR